MKYTLPKMNHNFDINVNGKETGVTFVGNFRYKRPSLGDRSRIEVMLRRLSGDLFTIDQNIQLFNEAVSHLKYTLEEFPDWWKESNFGLDLYDSNVVIEIYNECMSYEENFLKKLHSKGGDNLESENGESQAD